MSSRGLRSAASSISAPSSTSDTDYSPEDISLELNSSFSGFDEADISAAQERLYTLRVSIPAEILLSNRLPPMGT